MKIRDSGMPDRNMWDGFFSPAQTLETLEFNSGVRDAVEFGCGYGTFTIPAAKIIKGKIYALDIEPDMIQITKEEVEKNRLNNVQAVLCDFMTEGSGLPDGSVDYAMLFNILHLEEPLTLLSEANRILKKGGKVGIIHWNYDSSTPRGPSMDIRPRPEDCVKWAEQTGFVSPKKFDLKPYHYGIVMSKRS